MPQTHKETTPPSALELEPARRLELWRQLADILENYAANVEAQPVVSEVTPEEVRALLAPIDFSQPIEPFEALTLATEGLRRYQVHTPHPRYFGLFNPAPTTIGIAADALVAAFNPQLAAWKHNPFAVEMEQHLVRAFGSKFGYDPATVDGTFASGGSEANHTALLAALTHAFPNLETAGLRGLNAQPVFYVSAEGHHSLQKAARLCGLGSAAVREIGVDADLQMDPRFLLSAVREDRRNGFAPFLVVANAGTTNAGTIDPLRQIAEVAAREKIWLHVDAAWGGAAALVPELRPLLDGIERADSITLDAHKWLSAPMGAGVFLTRHPEILARTFHIAAAYVPPKAAGAGVVDPLAHSIQWSRRFIGLKVFLSLAVAGWEGYSAVLRHMVAMGSELRRELEASGWETVNPTPLPLVCFVDRNLPQGGSAAYLDAVAQKVIESGQAWISSTRVGANKPVLRACITNYRTGREDVRTLVRALSQAREQLRASRAVANPEA
jgi:glutamate/tyrosine decarboxylase-like PLP-dependent enzyme